MVACCVVMGCGSKTRLLVDSYGGNALGGEDPEVMPRSATTADKIDLLFAIDNSASMADKQEILRQAIPDLVDRLVHPRCVDVLDPERIVGTSVDGRCERGVLEFPRVHDIHVGIVSSSLGGHGSDTCLREPSVGLDGSPSHRDDQAHLVARTSGDDSTVAEAEPSGFLAWRPEGVTDSPISGPKPLHDARRFADRFADMVGGVGETGCGYEAQLESWYRFLVQPDPPREVRVENGRARFVGVDEEILKQRRDFLRPDSLVAIILVSDEDDASVDPRHAGGTGWSWVASRFPSSPNGNPPRGTSVCAIHPDSPGCRSCLDDTSGDGACADGGFVDDDEARTNVRFFDMKRRFGTDPRYPIERYVAGLREVKVPNREGEHGPRDERTLPYRDDKNCDNPLFSTRLPTHATEDLCHLEPGPRSPELVFFAVIGGVPSQLLHFDPSSTARSRLTREDWTRILGRDPARFDSAGIDPHMLPSIEPRPGLPTPAASNDADPIHGREWATQGRDLQYACTFPLLTPRDCSKETGACDCAGGKRSPLCDEARPARQVRGKAYPPVRELLVARDLGDQGIVASICPIHARPQSGDDPLYGYRPAMKALVDRLRRGLR